MTWTDCNWLCEKGFTSVNPSVYIKRHGVHLVRVGDFGGDKLQVDSTQQGKGGRLKTWYFDNFILASLHLETLGVC